MVAEGHILRCMSLTEQWRCLIKRFTYLNAILGSLSNRIVHGARNVGAVKAQRCGSPTFVAYKDPSIAPKPDVTYKAPNASPLHENGNA